MIIEKAVAVTAETVEQPLPPQEEVEPISEPVAQAVEPPAPEPITEPVGEELETPAELPRTAGSLSLLVLGGVASLIAALGVRRRYR
jgi:hypothetical protein